MPLFSKKRITLVLALIAIVIAGLGLTLAASNPSHIKSSIRHLHAQRPVHSHVTGSLTAVGPGDLTVKTANRSQTIRLGPHTRFGETRNAAIADITSGVCLQVQGPANSIGTVQATSVDITATSHSRCVRTPNHRHHKVHLNGLPSIAGTVVSRTGSTVEIRNHHGQVAVTLTPRTKVTQTVVISRSVLGAGQCIAATLRKTRTSSSFMASSITINTLKQGPCAGIALK